mgnify:CR=1 FL=1
MVNKKNIKRPYKKLTKAEYDLALQHPKWQKKRLKVFERDKWRCTQCKDTETTLCVHHIRYTKKYPWQENMKNLISLCISCHKEIHKIIK